MKFKVGDEVKWNPNAETGRGYNGDCYAWPEMKFEGSRFITDARMWCGNARYDVSGSSWSYTDDMLVLVGNPPEPVEASTTDDNPYWANIAKIAQSQRRKGLETYGHPLEDFQTPDTEERIRYIEEELIDALMYLEWLKDRK